MTAAAIGHEEDGTVVTVVGHPNIPESIRCLDTMARPDYVDLCTLTTSGAADKSAEEWARAVLEETPSARRFAFIPWRLLLGLRLGPRHSPDYVHGWKIAAQDDRWIRIETASWFITTHAVFSLDDGHVCFALFVRYDRPFAALVWPLVSIGHRQAGPNVLREALREQSRSSHR